MVSRLLNNWAIKLLSLLFALVLWFFLMGERRLEVGYTAALELENLPTELMVVNDVPSLIDVRLSGPRTRLSRLDSQNIRIRIDLSGVDTGLTTFRRLEERLSLPSGIRVTRLSPSFVDIKLERVASRRVPIKVVLTGAPPPGFELGQVSVSPVEAEVIGAESEIKEVREVETDPVDLSAAATSFTQSIPLHHEGVYTSLRQQKVVDVVVEIKPIEQSEKP